MPRYWLHNLCPWDDLQFWRLWHLLLSSERGANCGPYLGEKVDSVGGLACHVRLEFRCRLCPRGRIFGGRVAHNNHGWHFYPSEIQTNSSVRYNLHTKLRGQKLLIRFWFLNFELGLRCWCLQYLGAIVRGRGLLGEIQVVADEVFAPVSDYRIGLMHAIE